MNIEKFLKRLLGKQGLSWSDKKHYSNYVFENFMPGYEKDKVSKIFYLGSYRADRKYLNQIMKVIEAEQYNRLCKLKRDRIFVEDELGKIPYGDYAEIYLILYKNTGARIISELLKAPELPKIIPYEKEILFNRIISLPMQKKYCMEQIYPCE